MDYLPPVVIEHVVPSSFDTGWTIPRLQFRREKESVGADYRVGSKMFIGGRYGDIAHVVWGPVHDSRWMLKITVRP